MGGSGSKSCIKVDEEVLVSEMVSEIMHFTEFRRSYFL
jgi:hypothetical protein